MILSSLLSRPGTRNFYSFIRSCGANYLSILGPSSFFAGCEHHSQTPGYWQTDLEEADPLGTPKPNNSRYNSELGDLALTSAVL